MPNKLNRDSETYLTRKKHFDSLLTIYGRKPVLEALNNMQVSCQKIHLAKSNREEGIIREIRSLAERRNIPISLHDRQSLSRISRNQKQDQGVAADLFCPAHQDVEQFLKNRGAKKFTLLAVDGIHNPQNLGMIIRSVAASPLDGLILASNNNTAISPLVIKASAGAVFNCPVVRCDSLAATLETLKERTEICVLSGASERELQTYQPVGSAIYVVGNETEGVSKSVSDLAHVRLRLTMHKGVESLNVAVMASLLAFRGSF